jgi:hypothetical protein
LRYCGRQFTDEEITWIRRLIETTPGISRREVSRRFCQHVGWRKPDGGLKDMSCRVALLRLQRDGLLMLPPARYKKTAALSERSGWSVLTGSQPPIEAKAGAIALDFELVTQGTSWLWREFIDRYHYLGYTPLPGAQLRYFVKTEGRVLALLGFGAAAWKTAPRDEFIGWSAEQRQRRLDLIVNNARFLLLPWAQVKYLASRILAMAARRLPDHWEACYGYRPALLETFVEKERFEGTCYKAAGWICVGETKGRGKLDVHSECKLPVKTVWLRPLQKDFRQRLLV